ncbi:MULTISPECIES: sensor histidine kinase [unclassified Haematobacter]|uniref:sensor histidine kinase n=1 Tax=unclassified Haematobacter TaxID=2640585 RepID=UPI0025C05CFB|nr:MULTISPECIES: HAMP domain-containing sensor histidine kinase [unclassified Haematobacter]
MKRLPRRYRLNLSSRLALAAATLALLTVAAAGVALYGLDRTARLAAEAMAAQRRLEAYATYSGRVNEWTLSLISGAPAGDAGVIASLDALDRLTEEDIAAAQSEAEAAERTQGHVPARLRAQFGQLSRSMTSSASGAASVTAAQLYAASAPAIIGQQIVREAERRDEALTQMEAARRGMRRAAIAIGIAAPLVLGVLYLAILRPLFSRLQSASRAAERLVAGGAVGEGYGHDELGLLFARLRQMAARLDRRRGALLRDRERLGQLVEERTAELSRANERLEAADRQRRRFFTDVSHELRTPLTVILGEAELGAQRGDAETRAAFATIEARALRLFRRIEDLLRIARSESGQLELRQEQVDLSRVVAMAVADLQPLAQRGGLAIVTDVPSLVVTADPDWLRQVISGIVENAVKYAGRGATLTIRGAEAGQMAALTLTDDGPGMPPQMRAHLFDRFARAGEAPGFGVGLALAAWVAEAQGGGLELLPATEEQGTRLCLTLPLWKEET